MLFKMKIKNLAIIEDLEISFFNNLTALTGATGAGKSLLIDSLKLIFGKRADSDFIRHNEDEAIVIAQFKNLNEKTKKYLKSLEVNEDELTIERWISKKDRNKILANNKNITLKELKDLGLLLGDIHEQHDTQKLLDPQTALMMVDQLGNSFKMLNEYIILRHNYLDSKTKYQKALNKTSETNELLEQLKNNLDELEKANLEEGELLKLNESILTLSNQKEIIESLDVAYKNIKKINDENLLYNSIENLDNIKDYSESYKEVLTRIKSSYYELEDVQNELYSYLDTINDVKLEQLDELQTRYYFLKDLKNKYNKNISELINYQETLKEEILKVEDYDLFLENLKEKKAKDYKKAYNKGLEIRKTRKETAKYLEKEFIKTLKKLAIDYVEFKVAFTEIEEGLLKEDGIDDIEFMISLNEGEPLKPFYKVASGGELSRSMLALKILYGKIHNLGLMVFDEIDLGISGDAASKVAQELFNLSKERQVITITHLPQVAAKANKHYNIEKKVVQKRTTTIINDLNKKERIYHLAYMLSGRNLTEGAISHAKALLSK